MRGMTLIDLAENHNSREASKHYLAVVAGNCLVASSELSVHIRIRVAGNSGVEEEDPYQRSVSVCLRTYHIVSQKMVSW